MLVGFIIVLATTLTSSAPAWTITGDSVWTEDSSVFISATPATLRHSGYVYFNVTSKIYTGDVDLVFGFDTDSLKPKSIELYNPRSFDDIKSYICNGYANRSIEDKIAYCYNEITTYDNATNISNGSYMQLIFSHYYDTIDIPTKTIY